LERGKKFRENKARPSRDGQTLPADGKPVEAVRHAKAKSMKKSRENNARPPNGGQNLFVCSFASRRRALRSASSWERSA
jgi:hypothetical protein